jgi:hypothetical protein
MLADKRTLSNNFFFPGIITNTREYSKIVDMSDQMDEIIETMQFTTKIIDLD